MFSASSASTVVKNRLLAILATADIYGRICDEEGKKRTSERVELFSMFCEECFQRISVVEWQEVDIVGLIYRRNN